MDRSTAVLAAQVEALGKRVEAAERTTYSLEKEVVVLNTFIRHHLPFGETYWDFRGKLLASLAEIDAPAVP